MGKGGGESTSVRFAPYVEAHHVDFLDTVGEYIDSTLAAENPYSDWEDGVLLGEIEASFFGTGYLISDFPSLYDMYGKFMAGLDIEVLFDQSLDDTINGTPVANAISAEAISLSDELENVAYPRFDAGMRDINAVMSSTYVVGKAMMETERLKALSKFSANVRLGLVPTAVQRWQSHLDWNKNVIDSYQAIMKLYVATTTGIRGLDYDMKVKAALWPFQVLSYEGTALGALVGASDSKTKKEGGGFWGTLGSIAGAAMSFL